MYYNLEMESDYYMSKHRQCVSQNTENSDINAMSGRLPFFFYFGIL